MKGRKETKMQRNNARIIAGGRKICGNGERKFREEMERQNEEQQRQERGERERERIEEEEVEVERRPKCKETMKE